jgi:hypothetical protein
MTAPETPSLEVLTGEARLRQRSQRIRNIWITTNIGAGLLTGIGFSFANGRLGSDLPPLVFWALLAFLSLMAIATNIWFLSRVDELEVQDNLWAAYAGLSAHIAIAAGWYMAAARGFAPEPDVLSVLMATLIITLIAFVGLKLRRRLG